MNMAHRAEIADRKVRWQPRLGLPGVPLHSLIAGFFRQRDRRLVRHFGPC